MDKSIKCIVSFLIITSFIVSCQSREKETSDKRGSEATWGENMQGLASEVQELVPYLYNRRLFSDPNNSQKITEKLDRFSQAVHSVPAKKAKPFLGDDPMIRFSLNQLEADVESAKSAFQLGRKRYARSVMKSVMNHCFRCHSMTKVGASAQWTISSFKGLSLTPVEMADLMVATRKYDQAFRQLEISLQNAEYAMSNPFEYENAMKKYLALTVRIKKNPDRALELFSKLLEKSSVPDHLKSYLESWQASLIEWDQAKKSKNQTLSSAVKLLNKGKDRQSYFRDHAGDVEFLRATDNLHQLLKKDPTSVEKAKIYLMLGRTYEVLNELGYWGLHEVYYESCITEVPKSKTAQTCFDRLQASLYLGYSGSSGTHLPTSELRRLKKLKKMIQ